MKALVVGLAVVGVFAYGPLSSSVATMAQPSALMPANNRQEMANQYCVRCHNERISRVVVLYVARPGASGANAAQAEKVVLKLRTDRAQTGRRRRRSLLAEF